MSSITFREVMLFSRSESVLLDGRTAHKMPAQKHSGKTKREISYFLLATLMFPMALWQSLLSVNAGTQNSAVDERHRYSIELKLDFENLSYSGSERVRWFNRGDKPTSFV